jgi:8-oxo-dGTP pyrophosphatase MutT (NUDIX family)
MKAWLKRRAADEAAEKNEQKREALAQFLLLDHLTPPDKDAEQEREQEQERASRKGAAPKRNFAVAVLCITPTGIPLVRDPHKQPPLYWKLPGGKRSGRESIRECAARELEEETGIKIPPHCFEILDGETVRRPDHTRYFVQAVIEEVPRLTENPLEGEEVFIFAAEQVKKATNILPTHSPVIERHFLRRKNENCPS